MARGKKTGGRKAGTANKFTRTVKECVLDVFNDLQADPKHNLKAFAKSNPKDFYNIAAKLIPTDIKGNVSGTVKLQIVRRSTTATDPE